MRTNHRSMITRAGGQMLVVLALSAALLLTSDALGASGRSPSKDKAAWWHWSTGRTPQEMAFYRWMDGRYGREWAHTMQEETVRRLYLWFIVHIWSGTGSGF